MIWETLLFFVLFHLMGNTVENIGSRSAFTWMISRWGDKQSFGADYSHGYLIPFVSLAVVWYRRDPNLMLTEQWRADRATWTGEGWRLEKPMRFSVARAELDAPPATVVGQGITPQEIAISSVNADAQDIVTLRKSIKALDDAGRRTEELKGRWWHKISGPLSATLMPVLGAVAAFGLARSGQLFVRAVIGMALGFAYFVVDNAALAIGNFGGYPPFLAAWAPFLIFALLGEFVLLRTEE